MCIHLACVLLYTVKSASTLPTFPLPLPPLGKAMGEGKDSGMTESALFMGGRGSLAEWADGGEHALHQPAP